MSAYLDNCATTPPYPAVIETMRSVMEKNYANASAMHRFGFESEMIVRQAREVIADSLNVTPEEIIFTSGATESNNMALFGAAKVRRRHGRHIISTNVEHPSVRKVLDHLADDYGFELTLLRVDENGQIDLAELTAALKESTVLVSMMAVNNEIGAILPVNEAAAVVKAYNKNILFHVDAVQGYLKYALDMKNIDLMSVSAHKFHGPKGVGFLYKGADIHLAPMILGGSQQRFMRAGTLNTEGIAGMAKAVELYRANEAERDVRLRELKRYFLDRLADIPNIRINGDPLRMAPHVLSVSFSGVRSEVLLHALEEKGVYVSAGSACAAHSKNVSSVLVNIGLTKEEAESTLRFSFSEMNTKSDVDVAMTALQEVIPMLRKFVRR
ncbi:MAG: cysteine desulfurase family protein [Eubacteriales bacterium]|nr:cysteine desulfurase family protein [Eubacteriales bacterium]